MARCIVERMADGTDTARRTNPMNRLVPYLDLFARLEDVELARLAEVDIDTVATLRRQVIEVGEGLSHYVDLLPRLGDDELVRLTGLSAKTIRFWRLCQPRGSAARQPSAEISSITPMPRPMPAAPPASASAPASSPTAPRRRTTGVGIGAPAATTAPPPRQPVADWSVEAASTNCATTVTPPPRMVPAASWDTTSPTAGTATMITPPNQAPAGWAPAGWAPAASGPGASGPAQPSDMPTQPGAEPAAVPRAEPSRPAATRRPSSATPDPQTAARVMDIAGDPFPGYERFAGTRDEDIDLAELRR